MASTGRLLLAWSPQLIGKESRGGAAGEEPFWTVRSATMRSEAEGVRAGARRGARAGGRDAEASYRAAWKADPRPEFAGELGLSELALRGGPGGGAPAGVPGASGDAPAGGARASGRGSRGGARDLVRDRRAVSRASNF